MPLSAGTQLGPYEVTAQIGVGGMGEVYQATDTKLKRQVAIKVLPESVAADTDRLARFQREAEVLASLNHPHIAQIHGLEDTDGVKALVMELVEGPTLADRIAQGAIPVDEALAIAKQIAEALEAAHEQRIIHRDLKPANVKVREDGTVKVLDFGLAKALEPAGAGAPEVSHSPTMSARATQAGVILGTAAYMSPEQARGKPVDKRADVWAFGVVLYEMLTGKRAFEGEDVSMTLSKVLQLEPDFDAMPSDVPPRVGQALRVCLRKEWRERASDIHDVRLALEGAFEAAGPQAPVAVAATRSLWRRALPIAATAVLAGLVVGSAVWSLTRPAPETITRFPLTLPPGDSFTNTNRHVVALSPDGTRLVYVANLQLYLREMDQMAATPIRGTEESGSQSPFFSPDSQWVGFWANGNLRKVSVTGGASVTLCAAARPYGASWGADDTILFGQGPGGILRVAANGGAPEVLIPMDSDKNERGHGPQMLPDRKTVLFTLSTTGSWDDSQIVAQSLETGERRVLIEGGRDARYVPTGHLVYALGETLLAVPFDLARLEVTSGPVPVVEGVGHGGGDTWVAHASFSGSGSLVYVPHTSLVSRAVRQLVWVDREGVEAPLTQTRGSYLVPRVSPDGRRLAVAIMAEDRDIWVYEMARDTMTRLTFAEGTDTDPVWSPDGQRIAFYSSRPTADGTVGGILAKAADGGGEAVLLRGIDGGAYPSSWSADGKVIVFRANGDLGHDIGVLSLDGEPKDEILLGTPFGELHPSLSPDGRWLAYASDESGQREVYVRPFPGPGGKWQVSTGGGAEPIWARNGTEIFYRNADKMMAAPVSADKVFAAGKPIELFEERYAVDPIGNDMHNYDVAPDGQRFVMIKEGEQESTAVPINHVLNWFEELKRLVPTN